MNLLYALNFFFAPPPPADLAESNGRRYAVFDATGGRQDVLFFAGLGDEAFAATRGAIDNYIQVMNWSWG